MPFPDIYWETRGSWYAIPIGIAIHIIPWEDTQIHTITKMCPCNPLINSDPPALIHKADDGRVFDASILSPESLRHIQ